MMRMPELCIDELKNESYEVLIKEREKLLKELRFYEINKEELMAQDECSVTPSMHYGWNLRALATLCRIMEAKHHEECEIYSIEQSLESDVQKNGYSGIRRLLNKYDNRNLYETYYDDPFNSLESKLYIDDDYGYVEEVPEILAEEIKNSSVYFLNKPENSYIESIEFVRGGYSYPTQVYKYNHYKTKYKLYYSEHEAYGFPQILPDKTIEFENYKSFETRILSIIKDWRYVDYKTNFGVMDGEWWEFKIKFSDGKVCTTRGYNNFPENYEQLVNYLNKKMKVKTL